MNDIAIYVALIFVMFLCFAFGFMAGFKNGRRKKNKNKFPACDCKDVNQCAKWCHAKECFSKDYDKGLV